MLTQTTPTPAPVGQRVPLVELRNIRVARRVPVAEHVYRYAIQLARATRAKTPEAKDFVDEYVTWGAGPRASQYLILGGKARALLNGRFNVSVEDIQALAYPVMRHRILTNFHAESQRVTTDQSLEEHTESEPVEIPEAHVTFESVSPHAQCSAVPLIQRRPTPLKLEHLCATDARYSCDHSRHEKHAHLARVR